MCCCCQRRKGGHGAWGGRAGGGRGEARRAGKGTGPRHHRNILSAGTTTAVQSVHRLSTPTQTRDAQSARQRAHARASLSNLISCQLLATVRRLCWDNSMYHTVNKHQGGKTNERARAGDCQTEQPHHRRFVCLLTRDVHSS